MNALAVCCCVFSSLFCTILFAIKLDFDSGHLSLSLSLHRPRRPSRASNCSAERERGLAEYLYICHQRAENNEQCVPSCFISHQRRARCTKKHNIYGLHAEWSGFQKILQFVPRALLCIKRRWVQIEKRCAVALMAVFISKRWLLGTSKKAGLLNLYIRGEKKGELNLRKKWL